MAKLRVLPRDQLPWGSRCQRTTQIRPALGMEVRAHGRCSLLPRRCSLPSPGALSPQPRASRQAGAAPGSWREGPAFAVPPGTVTGTAGSTEAEVLQVPGGTSVGISLRPHQTSSSS